MKNVFPSYINAKNFRWIEVDNMIVSSIIISEYPKYISFLEILESIPKEISYDLSIYVKKEDTKEVLKNLTYNISSNLAELQTINKNQLDIDVIKKTKADLENLRYEIQINNEQIYNINIILTLYKNQKYKEDIINELKYIESKLYAKQIIAIPSNFRQLTAYISSIPSGKLTTTKLDNEYKIFTTSGLCNLFPFYTTTIFDKDGILFGSNLKDNRLCNINIFSNEYTNSNICIFGSSRVRKIIFY